MVKKPLGIYVHIPFCVRKCLYCDFLSMKADEDVQRLYFSALFKELENVKEKFCFDPGEYELKSIYIGGGTPSVVKEVYINKLLCKLYGIFNVNKLEMSNDGKLEDGLSNDRSGSCGGVSHDCCSNESSSCERVSHDCCSDESSSCQRVSYDCCSNESSSCERVSHDCCSDESSSCQRVSYDCCSNESSSCERVSYDGCSDESGGYDNSGHNDAVNKLCKQNNRNVNSLCKQNNVNVNNLCKQNIDNSLCKLNNNNVNKLCKHNNLPILSSVPEITLEANPGTLTEDKLKTYIDSGVNRLSIGLQSANDKELSLLGRIHDLKTFETSFYAAREAGFSNINIDIMTALPGQDIISLHNTISCVTDFAPEHISAYSLILEEGTPFYEIYKSDIEDNDRSHNVGTEEAMGKDRFNEARLPSKDMEREMYYMVRDELLKSGYERYEISNFSKKGYESRHNLGYWKRIPYIGLGLGASGCINEIRYKNTVSLNDYISSEGDIHGRLFEEKIPLSLSDIQSETMFLGLRTSEGVDKSKFKNDFGCYPEEVYPSEIKKYIREKLLIDDGERLFLTDMGIDYGNYVFSGFV